ncbi:hypothetical protein GCM10023175_30820 [Pseudonocardia xishanensis]|uniref:Integral membrane protein n=1 Tax=Pseudonocardia xishanensis TaxID=630995 RepID=A0ABP8RT51_9PSEU
MEAALVPAVRILGIAGVVIAVLFGWAAVSGGRIRAVHEQTSRARVEATVLTAGVRDGVEGGRTRVSAVWRPPGAGPHTGPLMVTGVPRPGDVEPLWVDRTTGEPAPPPTRVATAVVRGLTTGAVACAIVLAGVALLWLGVHAGTRLVNSRRWARDWARVEPTWSGRSPPR